MLYSEKPGTTPWNAMHRNPDSTPEQQQYLFVYGSLCRDMTAHPLHLSGPWVQYAGPGHYNGRLYDLGSYPAAVASLRRHERIHGEVYRIHRPAALFPSLDLYENGTGKEPPEYDRVIVPVKMKTGRRIHAWIYLYTRTTKGLHWIRSGDYVQYCHQQPYRRNMHK
jgi:gamma-glutamylcyclotransferase (GGCT)/AIG2-like uncharacterized protein YtfP